MSESFMRNSEVYNALDNLCDGRSALPASDLICELIERIATLERRLAAIEQRMPEDDGK